MIRQLTGLDRPACPIGRRGEVLLVLCSNGYICDLDVIEYSGLVIAIHPCIVERVLNIKLNFSFVKEQGLSQRNNVAKAHDLNVRLHQSDLEDLIADRDAAKL